MERKHHLSQGKAAEVSFSSINTVMLLPCTTRFPRALSEQSLPSSSSSVTSSCSHLCLQILPLDLCNLSDQQPLFQLLLLLLLLLCFPSSRFCNAPLPQFFLQPLLLVVSLPAVARASSHEGAL